MKKTAAYIFIIFAISSCSKGDDYCEIPAPITSIFEFGSTSIKVHKPADKIKVNLTYDNTIGDNKDVLYSFSTPDCFINPKGDYTEDIVYMPEYTYILKDTANPPVSITVYAYAFNDCGKTETISAVIKYN